MTYKFRKLTMQERNDLNREELQLYIEQVHHALDVANFERDKQLKIASIAREELKSLEQALLDKNAIIRELTLVNNILKEDKESFDLREKIKSLEAEVSALKEIPKLQLKEIKELRLIQDIIENVLLATFARPQLDNFHNAVRNLKLLHTDYDFQLIEEPNKEGNKCTDEPAFTLGQTFHLD